MKAFDTLTKEELAALTHEEIIRYIDYACAEEGIPLVPMLPAKPVEPAFEPDVELYEVAGHTVASMDEAESIQRVFNKVTTYSREYGKSRGNLYVYSPDERTYNSPSTIKLIKAISHVLYIERKKDIEEYNTAKAEYERMERIFSNIKTQREKTETWHFTVYRDAVEWAQVKTQLKDVFAQYLKLSDGSYDIAWNFLLKANEGAEGEYPGLKEELFAF